jgi:hypothetical protein
MSEVRKILIISHHQHELDHSRSYLLYDMRRCWEARGILVEEVCGVEKHVDADLAIVHIDLTTIPEEYLAFARAYPKSVNANCPDLRKTLYSSVQLHKSDVYSGPVIVKSVLNTGGYWEKWVDRHGGVSGTTKELMTSPSSLPIESKRDYKIYPSLQEVPSDILESKSVLIEKFLPEFHKDMYCLREWYFFGSSEVNSVELSKEPIFNAGLTAGHLARTFSFGLRQN